MTTYPYKPITLTAATTLNRRTHAGTLIILGSATGFTVSLPVATGSGDVYTFFVSVTVSSGSHVVAANGTDIIQGGVDVSTDIGGVTILAIPTADKITMDGSTTGGLKGSSFQLTDAASGLWMCDGFLVSSGAEATPFSAT